MKQILLWINLFSIAYIVLCHTLIIDNLQLFARVNLKNKFIHLLKTNNDHIWRQN